MFDAAIRFPLRHDVHATVCHQPRWPKETFLSNQAEPKAEHIAIVMTVSFR